MKRLVGLFLVVFAQMVAGLLCIACADVATDFESGLDGWIPDPDNSDIGAELVLVAGAGKDGSTAVRFTDPADGTMDMILAPSKFLGNLSGYDSFSFDFKSDQSTWDYNLNVWIYSADESTRWYFEIKSHTSSWMTYEFSLQEQDSTMGRSYGSLSWADTVANVGKITIDTEVFYGSETSFVDNISLNAVPEPASAMLLFAGFGIMGLVRRFYGRG